jgi:hypothetical protein
VWGNRVLVAAAAAGLVAAPMLAPAARSSEDRPINAPRAAYVNGWPLRTPSDGVDLDAQGVRVVRAQGKSDLHNAVSIAQYGLGSLDAYRKDRAPARLATAATQADWLLQNGQHARGGLYFPYRFAFDLGYRGSGKTIRPPWYSAMAQGMALSLLTQLWQATGDRKWRTAATDVFDTLDDEGPTEGPWTNFIDPYGYRWFEEYASPSGATPPMRVLNGHIFAMLGLYDYWRATGSEAAAQLFAEGAQTVKSYLPQFRVPGHSSRYMLGIPGLQVPSYHAIHVAQLRALQEITGDEWFGVEADRWASDPPTRGR